MLVGSSTRDGIAENIIKKFKNILSKSGIPEQISNNNNLFDSSKFNKLSFLNNNI